MLPLSIAEIGQPRIIKRIGGVFSGNFNVIGFFCADFLRENGQYFS